VAVDLRLCGLVEAWASGVEWEQLTAAVGLDEGDVVRVLRRTADFLAQMRTIDALPRSLRARAAAAKQLVDRPPIADMLS
jgi:superfamily II RNA helicase